jgi:3-hydroxyisobutyrate dehydrogenase
VIDMKVGFIGLGTMGGGMASCLQRRGFELVVHDVRREAALPHLAAGAAWADSPSELALDVECVFTSLPGPAEFADVVLGAHGLLPTVRRETTVVDLTTNSSRVLQRAHDALGERGVWLLDAPVSGGVAGATAGTLTIWVGGDEGAFHRVKPLLDAIGKQVTHIGPIGTGTVIKLVNNSVAIAINQVLMEGLSLGPKPACRRNDSGRFWEMGHSAGSAPWTAWRRCSSARSSRPASAWGSLRRT